MVSAALKQGKEDQMVTKAIENSALIDLLRAHFAYDNEAVALNDAFAQDMANRDDATIREAVPAFVSRVQAMRLELDTILAGVLVRAKAGAYEPLASPDAAISFGAGVAFEVGAMGDEQLVALLVHEQLTGVSRAAATGEMAKRIDAGAEPASQIISEWNAAQNRSSDDSAKEVARLCFGYARKSQLN